MAKEYQVRVLKDYSMNKRVALLLVLLFASAIILSYAASKFTILPLDRKSYWELQEQASPLFDMLMQGVSYFGEPKMAMALTVIAVMIFALQRLWLEAIFMVAAASNVLLTFLLKDLIHRARPASAAENASGFLQSLNQYSYPSGHVLFFVAFFGFFAYLVWMHFDRYMRMVVVAICAAFIILIGPSRVFLGEHWASDVVGSYIIGAIWLIVLILAYQWAIRRKLYG
jgi:membrane-associated phospholipid phosphatase